MIVLLEDPAMVYGKLLQEIRESSHSGGVVGKGLKATVVKLRRYLKAHDLKDALNMMV